MVTPPKNPRVHSAYSAFYPDTSEPPLVELSQRQGGEARWRGALCRGGPIALAMFLAEFLYPGYSVSGNTISDLGATCSVGVCHTVQPGSIIFNLSIILAGLLVLVSGFYLRRAIRAKNAIVALTLAAGAAMVGVGVFPENFGVIHGIV